MATLRIEHVNVTVSDCKRTSDLMFSLFGWHVRWEGRAQNGGYSIHVGTKDYYLAVHTHPHIKVPEGGFSKGVPLNHLSIEVDDLDAVEAKVVAMGLKAFNHADYDPGRRFYFFDYDGIEFEIVSYQK